MVTKGVKLDDDIYQRVDNLAKIRDRSPHWLMCAAIKQYVEREEAYEREKRDDIERWENYQLTGHAIDAKDALNWLDHLANGKDAPCPK